MDDVAEHYAAGVDATYGQRSALPDHEDDGISPEALAYLRNVRSEAGTIPHLLVAQDRPQRTDEDIYASGKYDDGAYFLATSSDDSPDGISSNQRVCYDALRKRFAKTRESLRYPPTSAILPQKPSLAVGHATHAQYNHAFLYTSPNLAEIANLSQDTVILGLTRYESLISKRNLMVGDQERAHLGAWGWALLAKSRVVGQLDSEHVCVIREVAKTSLRVMKKIRRESRASNEATQDDNVEPSGGEPINTEDGKTTSTDRLVPPEEEFKRREDSACFSLDILVTIIGEEFGQRDLLQDREIW